jgi:sugar phosphate isomerase/epimerase
MKNFKIGIDNYCLYPTGWTPLQILKWAACHSADGVAFSGLEQKMLEPLDEKTLNALRSYADDHSLYIEWGGGQHIPMDMTSWEKKDISHVNRRAASMAKILGTHIIRSCSGGLMRWDPSSPPTTKFLDEMAAFLKSQKQMLIDHQVILAIETHFEFTTFELVRLFDMCETEPGQYLGICLDTMNLLTMLEHPVAATRRILPWVVSTHIKDGGILSSPEGLTTFPTSIGTGIVDLKKIIGILSSQDHNIHLTIEDHGGSFILPVNDPSFLEQFPDLTPGEYSSLLALAEMTRYKSEAKICAPIQRDAWPGVWEDRITTDIINLKRIVTEISPT